MQTVLAPPLIRPNISPNRAQLSAVVPFGKFQNETMNSGAFAFSPEATMRVKETIMGLLRDGQGTKPTFRTLKSTCMETDYGDPDTKRRVKEQEEKDREVAVSLLDSSSVIHQIHNTMYDSLR